MRGGGGIRCVHGAAHCTPCCPGVYRPRLSTKERSRSLRLVGPHGRYNKTSGVVYIYTGQRGETNRTSAARRQGVRDISAGAQRGSETGALGQRCLCPSGRRAREIREVRG